MNNRRNSARTWPTQMLASVRQAAHVPRDPIQRLGPDPSLDFDVRVWRSGRVVRVAHPVDLMARSSITSSGRCSKKCQSAPRPARASKGAPAVRGSHQVPSAQKKNIDVAARPPGPLMPSCTISRAPLGQSNATTGSPPSPRPVRCQSPRTATKERRSGSCSYLHHGLRRETAERHAAPRWKTAFATRRRSSKQRPVAPDLHTPLGKPLGDFTKRSEHQVETLSWPRWPMPTMVWVASESPPGENVAGTSTGLGMAAPRDRDWFRKVTQRGGGD